MNSPEFVNSKYTISCKFTGISCIQSTRPNEGFRDDFFGWLTLSRHSRWLNQPPPVGRVGLPRYESLLFVLAEPLQPLRLSEVEAEVVHVPSLLRRREAQDAVVPGHRDFGSFQEFIGVIEIVSILQAEDLK